MTGLYDWNPMPHQVNVKCPECSQKATFHFAESFKIKLKKDVDFFKKSKVFDYEFYQDRGGQRYHRAIFYHGINSLDSIKDLPDGYTREHFAHSKYLIRTDASRGAVCCSHCGLQRRKHLNWPNDAFFHIEIKGQVLWAFDEETREILTSYIRSTERNISQYRYQSFLRHVPSIFLDRKNRDRVVQKLERLNKA